MEIILSTMEREALRSVIERKRQVSEALNEVLSSILLKNGLEFDDVLEPVDLDRGLVKMYRHPSKEQPRKEEPSTST